jgi:hypothetical protein
MIRYLIIFSFIYSIIVLDIYSQQANGPKIIGTTWSYSFGDCEDIIKFNNNDYLFYTCENNDTIFGTYFRYKNKITLLVLSKSNINLNKDSIFSISRYKYELLIIKNNRLIFQKRWQYRAGKWVDTNFKFDTNYCFIRKM